LKNYQKKIKCYYLAPETRRDEDDEDPESGESFCVLLLISFESALFPSCLLELEVATGLPGSWVRELLLELLETELPV
jgi:hypothetical protein